MITPTVDGREELLARCRRSVDAQTVRVDHVVLLDADRQGPGAVRNRAAARCDSSWLLPLDDDDELDPDCVEVLLANVEGADVVYPWCRMEGRLDGWVPNKLFWADALFKQNFIPVTALIRADSFRMLGGYRDQVMEDWCLWQWAYLHGLRFRCVPEVLWTYHQHTMQHFQKEA